MAGWLHQRKSRLTFGRIICSLEELIYRLVIVPLVAFLPAPFAYGLARLRGNWRYWLDAGMRKQIECNLEAVLGTKLSKAERICVARDFIRRQSCQVMDVMRIGGKGDALARLVEIRGMEYIKAALADGKGAVICSAHYGSYNSCFSLLGAYGFPVTVVGDWVFKTDPTMPPLHRLFWRLSGLEKRLTRHRRRPNIEPREGTVEAAIQMVEILRSNEVLAVPIDVPVASEDRTRAVSVDFLGQQILFLPGSVSIAQMTTSPVLALVVHRSADWQHQIVEISPPVPMDGTIEAAFKRCVALVEAPIYQNPAFWDFWRSASSLVDLGLLPTRGQF